MIRSLFILSLTAASAVAGSSAAECVLGNISVTGGTLSANYDAMAASDTVSGASVRLSGTDDCRSERIRVTISANESDPGAFGRSLILQSGTDTLVADLRIDDRSSSSSRRTQGNDEGGRDAVLSTTGGLLSDELILTLPAGQFVSPGLYRARVNLNADRGRSATSASPNSTVEVQVRVAPFVGLAASSSTTLNLGILQPGGQAERGVSFRAYSNTPYEIEVSSDNGWTLQRGRRSAGAISYEPVLSGAPLSGAAERSARFGRSRGDFQAHEFNAKVGEFSRAAAGIYSDWVTIRIRPTVGG